MLILLLCIVTIIILTVLNLYLIKVVSQEVTVGDLILVVLTSLTIIFGIVVTSALLNIAINNGDFKILKKRLW